MNEKQRKDLDVISRIDEEIIEKNTQKRIALFGKRKRNKNIKWIIPSAAAAVLVAIMVPLLLMLLIKQVPIYEGMTVLENYNGISSASIEPERRGNGFEFLSDKKDNNGNNGNNGNGNNGDNGNHNGHNKKPVDEIIEDDPSVTLEVPDQKMYYANPGQDIYINVHISNPDSFEILSFTLNGKKYSSYMFEDGSDMENLILKVNVVDAKGIIEYTIDSIKYVDGTDIKDVIMEGDRTIKVGVYSEGIQPKISTSNEFIGINDVSFAADLADKFALIERCGGKAYAFICDDESVLGSKPVELGENKIEFKNLKTGTTYRYGVFAYYDALDGKGMKKHILFEKEFTTKTVVAIGNPTIEQESISFNVVFNELFESKKLSAMTLYLGENKVEEVDVSGDVAKKTFTLTKLLSNNEYKLVIAYENLGRTETVEYTFKTLEKATPDLTITETEKTQTSFKFDITVTDVDKVGAITKIELVHGENVTNVEDLGTREFTKLLSNNDYTVKVTYTYDLNDGVGKQTLVKELKVKTEAKATPDFTITETEKTQTSFKFDITVTDVDKVGAITKIELVHGEDVTNVEDLATREFTDLLSNNDYMVKVTYTYDLNDGVGKQTLVKELTVKTEAKATPDFTITETEKTQTSFKFNITATDVDNVGAITKIELVHGENVTNVEDLETRELAKLLSNNDYTVKVTYTYDLNDGVGKQTLVKELTVKTEEKAEPTFTIKEVTSDTYNVNGSYDQTDVDNTLISYNVSIFKGKELVKENADKKIAFDSLNYYTEYTVKITYTFDVNDGKGVQTKTVEQSIKTLPYLDVKTLEVKNTTAVFIDECIYVTAVLDNPLNVKAKAVTINGIEYAANTASTKNILLVDIKNEGQFDVGEILLSIEKLTVTIDGDDYTVDVETTCQDSAYIYIPANILDVELVDKDKNKVDWILKQSSDETTDRFILVELGGAGVNDVKSVDLVIDGADWTDRQHIDSQSIQKIDEQHLLVPVGNIQSGEIMSLSTVKITINCASEYSSYSIGSSLAEAIFVAWEVRYISSVEEFLNCPNYVYAELTCDLDFSGITDFSGIRFEGVFNGNGYAIKNVSFVGDYGNEDVGIFKTFQGILRDVKIEDMFLYVSGGRYVGALVGSMSGFILDPGVRSKVENCSINEGSIISISNISGGAGIFIGDGAGVICRDCVNYANVSIDSNNTQN